jgi:DNA-binding NtrC family response regulator
VAPTKATVLLEGESGTGKELFARAIHDQSPRHEGPFVTINCAAMPEGLIESSLFGHEKGAFTGATVRTPGAFERANGGTLLLDEISEMRLDLQAKLLRVIQEQEFERVGGTQSIRVDVRLVATTNRDLRGEVEAGRFRQDLYYRLNVVPIHTPTLRERQDDVPRLLQHFLQRNAAQLGVSLPAVAPETLQTLIDYDWPGNIREMANAVERAMILSRGGVLLPEHFGLAGHRAVAAARPAATATGSAAAPAPTPAGATASFPTAPLAAGAPAAPVEAAPASFNLDELERVAIGRALEATGGNRTRAAKLLGISERTLRNKLNNPSADAAQVSRTAADSS